MKHGSSILTLTAAIAGILWASGALALRASPEDRSGSSGSGSLTISPTSLTFNATAGGEAPNAQTLSVTSSNRVKFTASASVQNGGNWLSISPSGQLFTNQNISVSAHPSGLAAGTYTGAVVISTQQTTQSVAVTLTVTSTSSTTLTVTPSSLSFSGTVGGATPPSQALSVTASTATNFTASASVQSGGTNWLSISPSGSLTTNQTLTVSVNPAGLAAGSYNGTISLTSGGTTRGVPVTFALSSSTGGSGGTSTGYKVIGWNDLGMHCDDGKDYSIFGVLPPYNTIHAHLVDASGNLVTSSSSSGYTITYQAVNDPLTNTLNTTSIGKTNFWQYAAALGFGSLAPDVGLKGFAMPGAKNTPQAMKFNTSDNTWMAEGIPLTNYADSPTGSYQKNYFPMMRLVAKNSSGTVIATTDIVLPISDELTCSVCHSPASASTAAEPSGGWITDSDPIREMKLNILAKHDELSNQRNSSLFSTALSTVGYSGNGLEATATGGKPVLCDACHASNALSLPGVTGVPPLTTAMHDQHSTVIDPSTNQTLDSGTTRETCYLCHPGPATQCLRGAMGTLKNSTGGNAIECQSCHGTLSTLANTTRQGWLDEPSCQECHTGTATSNSGQIVYDSVFTSGTKVRSVSNTTFATNANTPSTGLSLYRYSKGHGGLQCEACHGSTHAVFPTPIANDNVQSTDLQGHVGMLAECGACHGTVPSTTNGGPHGLHPIGTSWVSGHQSAANAGTAACQPCHGTDYRGTILSKMQADRTMAGKTFTRGTIIGCYSCHNGPSGGE